MVGSMSFLDNLENNLKNLENTEESRGTEKRRREVEAQNKAAQQAARPYAEALRDGPFTQELLAAAMRLGHLKRVAVRPTWIGDTLRLQARESRLDLQPTGSGVEAMAREGENELWRDTVDLEAAGAATRLAERWLTPSDTL